MNETTSCATHELIGCSCVSGTIDGVEPEHAAEEEDETEDESEIEDWDSDASGGRRKTSGFMPASQYKPPKEKKKRGVSGIFIILLFVATRH